MRKITIALALMIALSLLLAACGTPDAASAKDKLAEVKARGTLVISTDPAYPPQSALVENAKRDPNTKCA